MKLRFLLAIALLCAACSADGPAETPTGGDPNEDAAPGTGEATAPEPQARRFAGGAAIGKVVDEDWKLINDYTQMFYRGELEALHAKFSAGAKAELPLESLREMREHMLQEYGEEVQARGLKREENEGYRAYKRAVQFSKYEPLVEVAWVIAPDETIAGLFITPQRTSDP